MRIETLGILSSIRYFSIYIYLMLIPSLVRLSLTLILLSSKSYGQEVPSKVLDVNGGV